MIDIGSKEIIQREAVASGSIELSESTVTAIRNNQVKKGDVGEASKIAGIMAAKNTYLTVPFCHQIPLDSVEPMVEVRNWEVKAVCTVRAHYRTGVEMDALNCVSAMLLTVWDMVKYLEKDDTGNYPKTRIKEIKVVEKRKRNGP